ncbi:MAG: substrate-binding domain-containing protein [Humibacter sp.]
MTTMHQSANELGAVMASTLVKRIEGQPVERETILQTRLIVRGSS